MAELIESFQNLDTYKYILYVNRIIKKYKLEKENNQNYQTARAFYNSLPKSKRDPRLLYAIIMYGFNQQIRFNKDFDFNNPVGQRWFNDKVLAKLISFSRAVKSKNVSFRRVDYASLANEIGEDDFVYMDPPYRLTTGAYNDGKRGFKGWGLEEECRLFKFADMLTEKSIKFMISYVLEHKGKENLELKKWINSANYSVIECHDIIGVTRKEVLIVNYDTGCSSTLHNKEQLPKRGVDLRRTLEPVYTS